jgi:anti-sigma28 factor (negative regulator of flagellin synthesis)
VTGGDQIDFSDQIECVHRVRELPEIRQDKVERIRAAIQAGVYETDEKLDIALSRLLDEIG